MHDELRARLSTLRLRATWCIGGYLSAWFCASQEWPVAVDLSAVSTAPTDVDVADEAACSGSDKRANDASASARVQLRKSTKT